jgi:hypothetical protein
MRYSRLVKTISAAHVPYRSTLVIDADAALCAGVQDAAEGAVDGLAHLNASVGVRFYKAPGSPDCDAACAGEATVRMQMECLTLCVNARRTGDCSANTGVMLMRQAKASRDFARSWYGRYWAGLVASAADVEKRCQPNHITSRAAVSRKTRPRLGPCGCVDRRGRMRASPSPTSRTTFTSPVQRYGRGRRACTGRQSWFTAAVQSRLGSLTRCTHASAPASTPACREPSCGSRSEEPLIIAKYIYYILNTPPALRPTMFKYSDTTCFYKKSAVMSAKRARATTDYCARVQAAAASRARRRRIGSKSPNEWPVRG